MSDNELFIIVNVARIGNDPREDIDTGYQIPLAYKSGFIHTNRQSACDELLRLSHAQPNGKFVLFDAILFSRRKATDHIQQQLGRVYEIAPIEEFVL